MVQTRTPAEQRKENYFVVNKKLCIVASESCFDAVYKIEPD